jgi:c-di-GMP-binding flagellar brake protein YcgR
MNEMATLNQEQSEKVLQTVINEKISAILSYSSRGKWHVAKVLLIDNNEGRLSVESIRTKQKQHPINIQIDQPVGISFKHKYGKFVFDTTVINFEPSCGQQTSDNSGGTIVLEAPEQIKVVERRSYYRVEVPQSLKVKVLLWHRSAKYNAKEQINNCCQGRLIDISAGGAQIIIPCQPESIGMESNENQPESDNSGTSSVEDIKFNKGQFIGLRFTPMPYETPLTLTAQIRNVLPTENGRSISIGLQIVGLEASPEGHEVLTRLIQVVGQYYKINQTGVKQIERQQVPSLV